MKLYYYCFFKAYLYYLEGGILVGELLEAMLVSPSTRVQLYDALVSLECLE